MKKIKLNQLQAFLAVVDNGGFRQAAHVLGKTQPAVSQAVKQLESDIKQTLFQSGHHAQLSDFGKHVLPHVRGYVDHHQELYAVLFDEQQKIPPDNLNIVTQPSIAQRLIPQMIQSFIEQFPYAKITVRDTTIYQINSLLANHKADLAICTIHDIDQHHHLTSLKNDEYGVVAHKDHPIFEQSAVTWHDLSDYRLLENSTWDPNTLIEFQQLQGISQMSITNMGSLIKLLESGKNSVTVLPRLAFPKNNKQLKFTPLNPLRSRTIGVVTPDGKPLSEVADNFCRHILQYYQSRENTV